MALFRIETNSAYRLGVWKIEESEAQLVELSGIQAPTALHNPSRRLEHLAVRATAKKMGLNPSSIAYMNNGKPYTTVSDTHISISHTKGYAALLISNIPLIGVDIEHHSLRVLKIRKKFMHPIEEQHLLSLQLSENEELESVLLHWCAKEALFKAIPDDGIDFANELQLNAFVKPQSEGCFEGLALRSGQRFQVNYLIDPEFVLTCCFSRESK